MILQRSANLPVNWEKIAKIFSIEKVTARKQYYDELKRRHLIETKGGTDSKVWLSVHGMERVWRSQNPPGSKLPIINTRNLEQPPWCYVLWGVPAILAFVGSYAYGHSLLTVTEAGIFWTVSVAWIGTGCFLNGRSCGRVHCLIDGIAFPALSIVGALGVLSVIAINWSLFWAAFFVILVASFGVEFVWGRYSNKVWGRHANQAR